MQNLEELFEAYSADHQNEFNQKVHFICVPLIVYSVMGLLWTLPRINILGVPFNYSIAFAAVISCYYLLLSFRLAVIMILTTIVFFGSYQLIERQGLSLLNLSLVVFILAWIGQFYGHKVEGKKPSFLTDLKYLFVGPLWIVEKALRSLKR